MRDFLQYYTLDDDKNVVPVDRNSPKFSGLWDIDKRRVAEETVGDYWVSTVFLPMDHGYGKEGPPVVFETMVFPAGAKTGKEKMLDRYQERCSTWVEAQEMHKRIVQMVKDGTLPEY